MATVIVNSSGPASSGPPLVLLAPFPFDGRVWAEVAGLLGADAWTVDPPGFGGDPDADPSLDAYAQAVLDALDARGVGRFVVAGNSMGGYAAMALADLAPDRIAGLGLFGTKSTADTDEGRAGRLAMSSAVESGTPVPEALGAMRGKLLGASTVSTRPEVDAQVDAWIAQATPVGIAWAQRAMAARPDRTEVLAGLAVPAVVVRGSEDALMDAASQQVMADALGVEVDELAGCGHLIPLEAPAAAAEALARLWVMARAEG